MSKILETIKSNTLVAVSKGRTPDEILALYRQGQRHFGENYLQEAMTKIPILPSDIIWHFLGKIQTNKLELIVENFSWIQTISRKKEILILNNILAEKKHPDILIQVNVSMESQKNGVSPKLDEISDLIAMSSARGLMCIPSPTDSKAYSLTKNLFDSLKKRHPHLDTLSMGMSDDYRLALQNGSSMVRIGRALFG